MDGCYTAAMPAAANPPEAKNTKKGELLLSDKWNSLAEIPAKVKNQTKEFIPEDDKHNPLAWVKIY